MVTARGNYQRAKQLYGGVLNYSLKKRDVNWAV